MIRRKNLMNKTELVKVVAEKADLTQAVAADAVNAMVDAIVESLVEGNEVAILGFGSFKVTDRPARTARNPQTGEMVEVPESKAVSFKVSKALKEKLN